MKVEVVVNQQQKLNPSEMAAVQDNRRISSRGSKKSIAPITATSRLRNDYVSQESPEEKMDTIDGKIGEKSMESRMKSEEKVGFSEAQAKGSRGMNIYIIHLTRVPSLNFW